MKKGCQVTVSFKNSFGNHGFYDKCDKPAKFKVSYNQVPGGQRVTQFMCGIHKVATQKNAARINKLVGSDISKLEIEALLTPPDHQVK